MDFLTQPFSTTTTTMMKDRSPPAAATTADERSSIRTASTSDTTSSSRIESSNAAAFDQLRTASTSHGASGAPLEGETTVEVPSTKKGDWRAYGRVEASVVLWPDGTLSDKDTKAKDHSNHREQWLVSGTLWFTKRSEILLIVDQSVPPRQVASRPSAGEASSSSAGRRLSLSRLRSASPANNKSIEVNEHKDDSSPGFFTKVLDAVRPGRKERRASSSSSSQGEGLALSRSRSRSRTDATTTAKAMHGDGPESTAAAPHETIDSLSRETGQLKFDESAAPALSLSPFPQYKGHAVSGLYIASPSHVQSVRFYPQRSTTSPSSSSPFSFPFSKPSNPQPLSSSPPTGLSESSSPSKKNPPPAGIEHPVVELDVVDPAHLGSVDEGKKRQTTVGFTFVEVLCATEAEDFHKIVESAMSGTDHFDGRDDNAIYRTVSRSLETGTANRDQARRKSFTLKA